HVCTFTPSTKNGSPRTVDKSALITDHFPTGVSVASPRVRSGDETEEWFIRMVNAAAWNETLQPSHPRRGSPEVLNFFVLRQWDDN
ncbi:hypothetical protein ACYT69_10145, partial [Streptococcus pyogenes]